MSAKQTLTQEMELAEGFEDRTVFLTGAGGFVGSHIADQLVEMGADLHVCVHPVNGLGKIRHLDRKVTIHRVDLGDRASVARAIETFTDDEDVIVIHMAAQAHVGESWERPEETIRSNVAGTLNLLEELHRQDIDLFRFSYAGTSEEYGNPRKDMREYYSYSDGGHVILDEQSPLNPESVYASSKVAGEHLALNYYDGYGLPVVILRMFNNFGPRQNPRYITGTVITQALEKNVVNLGNLKPKRDFTYVKDGARSHLNAALYGDAGERYVSGFGENITIRNWVNLILEIGKKEGYWGHVTIEQEEDRFRPGDSELQELLVDNSKLREETGWEPKTMWDDGIRRTIEWYTENKREWEGHTDW